MTHRKKNMTEYGNMSKAETFWLSDPKVLIAKENLKNIIPDKSMSLDSKMNAAVRFTWYFAIVMLFITMEFKYFMIPFVTMVATVAIYYANKEKNRREIKKTEAFDNVMNQSCTKPTPENPYMNVLLNEYVDNPERPQACDATDSKVRNKMGEIFDKRLFRDVDDVCFDFSDRQFYTMPNTAIPNNQNELAQWLYGNNGKKTFKEESLTRFAMPPGGFL